MFFLSIDKFFSSIMVGALVGGVVGGPAGFMAGVAAGTIADGLFATITGVCLFFCFVAFVLLWLTCLVGHIV